MQHSFNLATFGLTLGLLDNLTELRVVQCNDLFSLGSPLGVIGMLGNLRSLALEDLHCRLYREPVAELGRLTAVSGQSLLRAQSSTIN